MVDKIDNRKIEEQYGAFQNGMLHNFLLIAANIGLLLTFTVYFLFRGNYNLESQLWVVVSLVAVVLAYILLPDRRNKSSKRNLLVGIINHLVAFLALIFIVPVFGPYILILPLLMFSDAFRYGRNGIMWNLFGQSVAIVAAVLHQYDNIDLNILLDTMLYLVLLDFTGIVLWRLLRKDYKDKQYLEELKAKKQLEQDRLLSLVNSMTSAVIATDNKGLVTVYNAACLELLDTNESLLGKNIQESIKLTDEQGNEVNLLEEAKGHQSKLIRRDIVLKIGESDSLILEVSVSAVRPNYSKNSVEGYVVTMRDITKEKSLEEQRDDFISVTSHELRTPIAITEANLSTALLDKMSEGMQEKTKELVETAHKNVLFLGSLVSDLSTLARAEKNFLDLELKKIDPRQIIEQLNKDYTADASSKGLKIDIRIDKKPSLILTSELYLKEVLQNFMTNAIKYSQKGSIEVSVENAENDMVKFSVKDTGIGISASDQKKLFTKFFRAEDYRTRETGGTGLGLYISKKLAERMGGKLWFESELNKGSTFFLQLPAASALEKDTKKFTEAEINEFASDL